jgi:hypothetical protein
LAEQARIFHGSRPRCWDATHIVFGRVLVRFREIDKGDFQAMSCHQHNVLPKGSVVRLFAVAALLLVSLLASPAFAVDSGDILVVSAKGGVRVTMNGAVRAVRGGSVLELPATVQTGGDGAIELRQGTTTVAVGPDTHLEFPALEKPGAPIDRVVQPRGNAFYNIGKREGRKLRIETPYLVGVVKGTQFNVSAQEGSTTISLFEGLLEVRAADDSSIVELKAGEIANRHRGESAISVLKMDAGKAPSTGGRTGANSSGGNGPDSPALVAAPSSVDATTHFALGADPVSATASVDMDMGVNPDVGVTVDAGNVVVAGVSTNLNLGNEGPDLGVDTSVSVGNVADVNTGLSVGAGLDVVAADVAVGAQLDVGPAAVDVGTNAGLDLGTSGAAVDVVANVGADAGVISAGVDVVAAVDVGADSLGASVDAGAALGGIAPVNIDAGLSTAVDVSSGTVDIGVNVVGIDLGVNLDLGLDDDDNGNGNESDGTDSSNPATTPPTPGNLQNLLDGLLRRPGRK